MKSSSDIPDILTMYMYMINSHFMSKLFRKAKFAQIREHTIELEAQYCTTDNTKLHRHKSNKTKFTMSQKKMNNAK